MNHTNFTFNLFTRFGWPIALGMVGVWVLVTMVSLWNNFAPDLSAVYFASYFYGMGAFDLVYASPDAFFGAADTPEWLAELERHDLSDQGALAYIYPPIWAAALSPLASVLDPISFSNAAYAIQIPLIGAMILLWRRISQSDLPLPIWVGLGLFIAITSTIVATALFHNQPQITVSFLCLLAIERFLSGRQITAGVCLGIAAAIKISPIALILIFFLNRGSRAAFAALATSMALALLSLLIAGPDLHWQFVAQVQKVSSMLLMTHVNYNLELFLFELWHVVFGNGVDLAGHVDGSSKDIVVPEPGWLRAAVLGFLAFSIGITIYVTRGLNFRDRVILQFACLWLTVTLCAPMGWNHYYLPIVLMLPGLARFCSRGWWIAIGLIVIVATHRTTFDVLSSEVTALHAAPVVGVAGFLGLLGALWIMAWRQQSA